TGEFEDGQVIGKNRPTGLLREHVKIPAAPAIQAVEKETSRAQSRTQHHDDCGSISPPPGTKVAQAVPSVFEKRAHDRKRSAWEPDNPRRRHEKAMQDRQYFRDATFRATPKHEPKESHHEERLGVTGHEKKRRWMRHDCERAEKLQKRRDPPAFAEEEKITPEPPGRDLRDNEQRVVRAEAEPMTQQGRERGIRGEKRHVGDFHHFMADRRNGRLLATIDDVRVPIALML